MMSAKAIMRSDVAALCMVSSRALVLSFIQGKTTTTKSHTASSRVLFSEKQPRPGFACSVTYRRRAFCIKATSNSEKLESIGSPLMKSMENKIKEQLGAEFVDVKDAYGDGRHVSIVVISSAFEGQSAVNRQRMVYKAIWEELQDTVHAVDQMTTRTPSEAASGN